jgi:protein involved in polysaccharide export with SLBB domain
MMNLRSALNPAAKTLLALALAGTASTLGGCKNGPTAAERAQLSYFAKSYERSAEADRFVVAPPDSLLIRTSSDIAPEIDNTRIQIAPDGTIAVGNPAHRIKVAGLTPHEVEERVASEFSDEYKDLKVRVDVDYRSQFYYVIGEVNSPGAKRFTGRDTLVAVLADANVTRLGWPERIYVLHPSPDATKRHATVINLYDIVHHGDSTADILLAQDDIVYVPLNPLAAIGVAFQNLLFPIQPALEATGSGKAVLTGGL